jgi:hypothetical protein
VETTAGYDDLGNVDKLAEVIAGGYEDLWRVKPASAADATNT